MVKGTVGEPVTFVDEFKWNSLELKMIIREHSKKLIQNNKPLGKNWLIHSDKWYGLAYEQYLD